MKVGCIGELVVDFICPDPVASVADAVVFEKHPGGSPANVAAACEAAGIDVLLLSKVGKGAFGQFTQQALQAAGCTTSGIQVDKSHPTRCVFMAHDEGGRRSVAIANRRSADQFLEWDQVRKGDMAFDVLHIGGTTMLGEETAATTFALVAQVKANGGLISYDPNINLARVAPGVRERTSKLIQLVDLLKVNDAEWEMVKPMLQAAGKLRLLVHTQAAAGAVIHTPDHHIHIDPPAVAAKDVTGAGDAFYGGLLGYLVQHAALINPDRNTLIAAGAAGSRLAGQVIQQHGGFLSLQNRK
ncbi:MAG: PfkB family carbohydrate kinase [Bacteroidota bacterium]